MGHVDRANNDGTRPSSGLVVSCLFPDERYYGEWRRHWIHLARPITIGILATVATGFVGGYLVKYDHTKFVIAVLGVWLGILGWVVLTVVAWHGRGRLVLTNVRLMTIEPRLVTSYITSYPLGRVRSLIYSASLLGRLLGYGTFEIEVVAEDPGDPEWWGVKRHTLMTNLSRPEDVYNLLSAQIFG
jgi:hypothetical protein